MRFESLVTSACLGALGVSTSAALIRGAEERRRRASPGGTELLDDGHGRHIEYDLSGTGAPTAGHVLVCENGLGSPLEYWDWIVQELQDDVRVLRYHRRGYARTTSRLRPAVMLERLLDTVAPGMPVVLVGHSIGGLVAANVLQESTALRSRARALWVIDGTDADLLQETRRSPENLGRYRQMSIQEALSSVTGMARWTVNKTEADANFRATVQKSYLTVASSPSMMWAAHREYVNEPLDGQHDLRRLDLDKHVVAAGDNITQQRDLASKIGADFRSIDGSNHRSIIGKITFARQVAGLLRGGVV